MTKERFDNELMYQISINPFKVMLKRKIISEEDFKKVDEFLKEKYHPIFVSNINFYSLDNTKE